MKEHRYTVKGIWPFPVDMLRHDGSCAATAEDKAMIDRLSGDHAPDRLAFAPVEIALVGPWKPNTARWESFSWSVPGDAEHAVIKAWREEARRERNLFDSAIAKLTAAERAVVIARTHHIV